MAIKLTFEAGHSASRKTKPSKEGFTYDWELFLRGTEGNDITHFVDKIVFNLHESFPKPRRTVKEPPYTVKESGYAGFELTIDVYLKNRDDPKKLTFPYDLDLQPFKNEIKEYIIENPSDDFKRKCMKGGCIMVGSSMDSNKNRDYKSSAVMLNEMKKPKRPDEKQNNTFTNLFGEPIEKSSSSKIPTKSNEKLIPPSSSLSQNIKEKDKLKHKYSPINDGKDSKKTSESSKSTSEKAKKDKSKDRDRNEKKEKISKRPPSPNLLPSNHQNARTNANSLVNVSSSKNEYSKNQAKQTISPAEQSLPSSKKSSKKKSYEKDREKSDKKIEKSKLPYEPPPPPPPTKSMVKEFRETIPQKSDDREKIFKSKVPSVTETKMNVVDPTTKKHEKDAERKHKHKKKEKSKEKDNSKEKDRKDKGSKQQIANAVTKSKIDNPKTHLSEDDSCESDHHQKQDHDHDSVNEPFSLKANDSERLSKKVSQREKAKGNEKEEKKSKKRPLTKNEDRDPSPAIPAKKKKEEIISPIVEKAAPSSMRNNNNAMESIPDMKISNEYLDELKDLKQKITTLKNNDHLQHVVRLIASTGCYEITKSSFDFDLISLDRKTVERLQEFFSN